MDLSTEYVVMCDTASEIQILKTQYDNKDFVVKIDNRSFWLPRIDQLIEEILKYEDKEKNNIMILLNCSMSAAKQFPFADTLEKLLLCVLMINICGKGWDVKNKKWINAV